MTATSLPGYLPWLSFLACLPDPRSAFSALMRGPLAGFDARGGMLWRLRDDGCLVALASVGHTPAEVQRGAVIPLTLDLAVTRAVTTAAFVPTHVEALARDFQAAAVDDLLVRSMGRRLSAGPLGVVPVLLGGRAVGAFGFMCGRPVDWTDDQVAALRGVGAALGLWLTNPRSPVVDLPVDGDAELPLVLSPRQVAVLRLVEARLATADIARRLGYSTSTVSAEIGTILRVLHVDDRALAAARARAIGLLDEPASELAGIA